MSRIAVLSSGRDRSLLEAVLERDLGHELIECDGTALDDAPMDLCILDPDALRQHGDCLAARKRAENPVFLPVLLLVDGHSVDTVDAHLRRERDDDPWQVVDDTLPVPARRLSLERRVESLLRIRRQSVQLRESEARFRAIFEQNLSGIFLVRDGRFEYVNERLARIFGRDRADLLECRVTDLVAPVDRERLLTRIREFGEGDRPSIRGTFEGTRPDGTTLHFVLEARRIDLGGDDGTVGTVVDITERVEAGRRAQRRAEELALLNRIIRHDVRNDLNVIIGWGELLREHVDEAGAPSLERILDTAAHIDQLTVSTGDLAAVLDERGHIDLRPVNLSAVLTHEVETLRARYSGGTPAVRVEVDGDIPSDLEVLATGMLSSVFDNLLGNAVVHGDPESVEIEVGVSVQGDVVEVTVADNGPGVPDDRKEDLFGRGVKGLESPGTGLGLYFVESLIEEYGGSVWVEDNDPTGAVFGVALQRA
ncbi:MAG: PAS domain S-box protein [Halodesulfurarchaeum sp.]